MKITKANLNEAVKAGLLTEVQVEELWTFLLNRGGEAPSFRATHIFYYLGGMIAMGAMTLFMNLGWEAFGGKGIFVIASCYGLLGLALAEGFYKKEGLRIPAGIMAAFAVALTPLAVYGLQAAMGYWEGARVYRDYHVYIDWRWLSMELTTLAVGAAVLARFKIPFLVFPLAATLWYMSMDLAPFLFQNPDLTWELRRLVSLWFGLAMTVLAFWVDFKAGKRGDFAFWLYLFGLTAFWGGLSLLDAKSEWGRFFYLCVNLLLLAVGAVLSRRTFAVFGGLGVVGYLNYLAWRVFAKSLGFPFVLSLGGFAIIGLGVLWQRNEGRISKRLRALLPHSFREFLESRG